MKEKSKESIRLLLHWAGGDRKYLIGCVICAFISGITIMIPYLTVYDVIKSAYDRNLTRSILLNNTIIAALAIIIRYFLFSLSGLLAHKGAYGTLYRVRCKVINHMAKVPLGDLSDRTTGEIKKVLNEDIEKLELFLAHHLPDLIMYACGPAAVFLYLATVNLKLAFISLMPIPFAFICQKIIFKRAAKLIPEINKSLSDLNSTMIEYISGMRLIKAYNMGGKSFKKYSDAINSQNNVAKRMARKISPLFASYVIIIECSLLFLLPTGGNMNIGGNISASLFILFLYVGSFYLTELRPLLELGSNFTQVLNGVEKTKEILDVSEFKGGIEAFPENHNIEFRNVSFAYDDHNEVLKNVNLNIKDGEKIALVGPSGAGKSTIIELISRFYDTSKGEILIGGKNIKDIDYETLLSNISIVFQQTFLTNGSVIENIRMGNSASFDKVRNAAKQAQIDDFIMSLPNGYDTLVGNCSSRFSGGEKQRIAIARAILKNAPILILDEATSAADPENQMMIDKAINNLCAGKTVIIVAHRLDIVKKCDRVAVVKNNTIEECGNHSYMIDKNLYYRNAWQQYNSARNISYNIKEGELDEQR